ncbi:transposase [Streptomyces sp. NPDC059785]|uniref:transposase n=1 Tax=Streptomyces sp. NPDC059785 TaxID=3346945 RepID=UPI00365BE5A9
MLTVGCVLEQRDFAVCGFLAAVFAAGLGDVTRFPSAKHLRSWAGPTPRRHESDL